MERVSNLEKRKLGLQLVGNDGSRTKRSFGKGYRKSTTKIQRRACLVSAFLIFSVSYIQLPYIIFFNFVSLFCYKKNETTCTRHVKPNDGPCQRKRT